MGIRLCITHAGATADCFLPSLALGMPPKTSSTTFQQSAPSRTAGGNAILADLALCIWCHNTARRKGNLRCKRVPSSGSRRYPHIRPTAEPIHTIPLARVWDKNAQMTFNPPNPPVSNWASFLRGPGVNVAVITSIGVQIVRYLRVLLQGPIRPTRRIAHQGIDLSVEPDFLLRSLEKLIQGSSRAELERFCLAQLQIDGFRRTFCSGGSGDLSPCWVSHWSVPDLQK